MGTLALQEGEPVRAQGCTAQPLLQSTTSKTAASSLLCKRFRNRTPTLSGTQQAGSNVDDTDRYLSLPEKALPATPGNSLELWVGDDRKRQWLHGGQRLSNIVRGIARDREVDCPKEIAPRPADLDVVLGLFPRDQPQERRFRRICEPFASASGL